jgi:hypothetical protein
LHFGVSITTITLQLLLFASYFFFSLHSEDVSSNYQQAQDREHDDAPLSDALETAAMLRSYEREDSEAAARERARVRDAAGHEEHKGSDVEDEEGDANATDQLAPDVTNNAMIEWSQQVPPDWNFPLE